MLGACQPGRAGRAAGVRRLTLAIPLATLVALLAGGSPATATPAAATVTATPATSCLTASPAAAAQPIAVAPAAAQPHAQPAADQSGGGLPVAGAEAVVRSHGYTPADTSGYDPDRTLSVIIGVLATSADGHPQRAFFFNHGQYVGIDAPVPSAGVSWVWSTDDTMALQYQLYRPDDPMCCPTGGASTVRFQWLGGRVVAADHLPSSDWNAPLSRR